MSKHQGRMDTPAPAHEFASPDVTFPSTNRRMQHIRSICDQVAPADVPVLLLGESGVGKEVLARYIFTPRSRGATKRS